MSSNNPFSDISVIDKILIYEPNERGILWLIANQPTAFTVQTFIDISKKPHLMKPNPDSNLAKALPIVIKLHDRGFIKSAWRKKGKGQEMITKITWKGKFYRLYTHPAMIFWATLVGIATLIVSVLILIRTPPVQPPAQKKVSTSDSILGH